MGKKLDNEIIIFCLSFINDLQELLIEIGICN